MRYAVRSWLALVALLCTIAASAAANESELYRTTVFVTGRGEAEFDIVTMRLKISEDGRYVLSVAGDLIGS